jgi:DNA-binding transcriptional ArsR family regulator
MNSIEKAAGMFKVLSDPTRLKIVKLLAESGGPLCVNAITHRLGVSQSAVSQHLRVLRQTGLATGDRYGSNVHYSLNVEVMAEYREMMREVIGSE